MPVKIEPIDGKNVKIWMTQHDMRGWGLCFEDMNGRDRATNAAVSKLLAVMQKQVGIRLKGAITVEAVRTDDGCVLLFSSHERTTLSDKPLPQIYAVASVDGLLAMRKALPRFTELPAASLYEWGEEYRLIVYSTVGSERIRPLTEWCERVGEGVVAAAFVDEYGRAITVGNALHRLCEGIESL